MIPSRRLSSQRGATIFGMVFLAIIVSFVALIGLRVFPSINEYLTIRKVVGNIMRANPSSPGDIRQAFGKGTEIEYSIKTIGPKDLEIQQVGDGFRTVYKYNVEVEVVDPVYLLVKYSGSATTPGAGKGP